nr:hypothetical protein [Paracoccus saliphilus]
MGGTIIRTSPVQIEVPTASEMPPVITSELKGAMERVAAHHAERVRKRLNDEARAKKRRAKERLRAAEQARDLAAHKQLIAKVSRSPWSMSPVELCSGIALTLRLKGLMPEREKHLRKLRDQLQQELNRQCRELDRQPGTSSGATSPPKAEARLGMESLLAALAAKFAKT